MGLRFDETARGRIFFERQLPKLIKAIEENTKEMKRANDLKEQELNTGGEKDESLQTDGNSIHDSRG